MCLVCNKQSHILSIRARATKVTGRVIALSVSPHIIGQISPASPIGATTPTKTRQLLYSIFSLSHILAVNHPNLFGIVYGDRFFGLLLILNHDCVSFQITIVKSCALFRLSRTESSQVIKNTSFNSLGPFEWNACEWYAQKGANWTHANISAKKLYLLAVVVIICLALLLFFFAIWLFFIIVVAVDGRLLFAAVVGRMSEQKLRQAKRVDRRDTFVASDIASVPANIGALVNICALEQSERSPLQWENPKWTNTRVERTKSRFPIRTTTALCWGFFLITFTTEHASRVCLCV